MEQKISVTKKTAKKKTKQQWLLFWFGMRSSNFKRIVMQPEFHKNNTKHEKTYVASLVL